MFDTGYIIVFSDPEVIAASLEKMRKSMETQLRMLDDGKSAKSRHRDVSGKNKTLTGTNPVN